MESIKIMSLSSKDLPIDCVSICAVCTFSSTEVLAQFFQSVGAYCTSSGCNSAGNRPLYGLLVDKQESGWLWLQSSIFSEYYYNLLMLIGIITTTFSHKVQIVMLSSFLLHHHHHHHHGLSFWGVRMIVYNYVQLDHQHLKKHNNVFIYFLYLSGSGSFVLTFILFSLFKCERTVRFGLVELNPSQFGCLN